MQLVNIERSHASSEFELIAKNRREDSLPNDGDEDPERRFAPKSAYSRTVSLANVLEIEPLKSVLAINSCFIEVNADKFAIVPEIR